MTDPLITSLIDDWHWLTTELPTPQRPEGRSSNTVNFGHPAQWASDMADEIADVLASLQDILFEAMGAGAPYGHIDNYAWESKRIGRAGFKRIADWFLENPGQNSDIRAFFQQLNWAPVELIDRMDSLHKEVLRERARPEPKPTEPWLPPRHSLPSPRPGA